jgi:hypothetical protein
VTFSGVEGNHCPSFGAKKLDITRFENVARRFGISDTCIYCRR